MMRRLGSVILFMTACSSAPNCSLFCVALVYHRRSSGNLKSLTLEPIQLQLHQKANSFRIRSRSYSALFNSDDDSQDKDDEEEYNSMMEQARLNAPDSWTVTKQLLGVNVFTFILAGLIVFFLSMNLILGPGWLGQQLGVEGTGNLGNVVSEKLPLSMDLSQSPYLLF